MFPGGILGGARHPRDREEGSPELLELEVGRALRTARDEGRGFPYRSFVVTTARAVVGFLCMYSCCARSTYPLGTNGPHQKRESKIK